MKIVNKYQLALCPNGTMFYELGEGGGSPETPYILNGTSGYDLKSGKPWAHGAIALYPDCDPDGALGSAGNVLFDERELPKDFMLYEFDFSTWEYSDDFRFLILEPHEIKYVIELLTEYYNQMKGTKTEISEPTANATKTYYNELKIKKNDKLDDWGIYIYDSKKRKDS